jgi:hypothetical protein
LTTINEDNCLEFTSRSKACPSWPVRIAGMQGLWRYIGPLNSESVEVIGPYFPGNPARNGGRSRIFKIEQIKYAGKSAKPVDVLNVETTALSNDAKRARRR